MFIGSLVNAARLDLVFAGCRDGNLYAFDLATGALRWRLAEHGCEHPSPAIVDHVLNIGCDDGYVYAFG